MSAPPAGAATPGFIRRCATRIHRARRLLRECRTTRPLGTAGGQARVISVLFSVLSLCPRAVWCLLPLRP